MKTVIFSLLIFSIIIGFGIGHFCIINNYMLSLNEHIDKLDTAVKSENPQLLYTELKKTEEEWQNMRSVLCLIIKHDYIFEVDSAITELFGFAESFDAAEASLSVSKARAGAECITETSSFTIENII